MDWTAVAAYIVAGIVLPLLGGGVTWYIAIRRIKPDERRATAETSEVQARTWQNLNAETRLELKRVQVDLAFERKDNERLDALVISQRAEIAALKAECARIPDLESEIIRIPRLEKRIIHLLEKLNGEPKANQSNVNP